MNEFIFENCAKVYFGEKAAAKNLKQAVSAYGENVMLCYGGSSIVKNGIFDEISVILTNCGKTITEFSGIMANPTYDKVMEGALLARKNNIDFILAVGGGSVIDCSKAISMAAKYDGDMWNDFIENKGDVSFSPLPIGAVVTVTGTGSELNGDAVITNNDKKIKTGHSYKECVPRFAILDPAYTYTVSKLQTASGGFDILSHIMEIFFSRTDEDNVSDDISLALMKSVVKNLPIAIEKPDDYTSRSNLMWASSLALCGLLSLSKDCDFEVHQIEHQLAAYTDCIHGCGLAAIHPAYYRHIYKFGLKKFVSFAVNLWGVSQADKTEEQIALEGIARLEGFIKEIGLPYKIEMLIKDKNIDLRSISKSCNKSKGAYKVMTDEEIYEIMKEAY